MAFHEWTQQQPSLLRGKSMAEQEKWREQLEKALVQYYRTLVKAMTWLKN